MVISLVSHLIPWASHIFLWQVVSCISWGNVSQAQSWQQKFPAVWRQGIWTQLWDKVQEEGVRRDGAPNSAWKSLSSVLIIPNRQHSSFARHFTGCLKLRGSSSFCDTWRRAFRQVVKEVGERMFYHNPLLENVMSLGKCFSSSIQLYFFDNLINGWGNRYRKLCHRPCDLNRLCHLTKWPI